MCCFVIVLGLLGPRIAFVFAWLATDRVTSAFQGNWIIPLLAVLFLPWTGLAYVFAWAPLGTGVTGIGWAVVALGFILDIATYSSRAAQRRM